MKAETATLAAAYLSDLRVLVDKYEALDNEIKDTPCLRTSAFLLSALDEAMRHAQTLANRTRALVDKQERAKDALIASLESSIAERTAKE